MKPHNSEYAGAPDSCANDAPVQLAIRETRETAGNPRFWAGLAAVILILAIAAPFDTGSRFTFPTLVVYWGAIAVCTFFLALPTSVTFGEWARQRGLPPLPSWTLGGAAAGVPVTVFVVVFNRLFFGIDPIRDHGLGRFFLECMSIAVAIVLIYRLLPSGAADRATADERSGGAVPGARSACEAATPERAASRQTSATEAASVARRGTPFHQRLGPHLGDDIVTLQAQDHYVDVTTTAGHEMILMRLADAERELDVFPGLRVHRSWWVAEAHVASLERRASRVFVVLDTGDRIPVSRSRVTAVQDMLEQRSASVR